jgi:hypothetical protein
MSQWAERGHQLGDVGVGGGSCGEHVDDRIDRVGEGGEQREVERGGDLDQAVGAVGALDEAGGGGPLDGGAVPGELDEPHRPLGPPLQPPRLAERAARARGPPRAHPTARRAR